MSRYFSLDNSYQHRKRTKPSKMRGHRSRIMLTLALGQMLIIHSMISKIDGSTKNPHSPAEFMMHFETISNVAVNFVNGENDPTRSRHFEQTLISCALNCAKDNLCLAFYFNSQSSTPVQGQGDKTGTNKAGTKLDATDITTTTVKTTKRNDQTTTTTSQDTTNDTKKAKECVLYGKRINYTNIQSPTTSSSPGGVVGNVKDVQVMASSGTGATPLKPPDFYDSRLSYITRTQAGLTAIYNCTGGDEKITSFGWTFDETNWEWPQLEASYKHCADTICMYFKGAAAAIITLLSYDRVENMAIVKVTCGEGETVLGSKATCYDWGEWLVDDEQSKLACVSPYCYREEPSSFAAHYRGTQSRTAKGHECLPWKSQMTNSDWIEDYDGAGLDDVKNYCRDQDKKTSVPWCFVDDFQFTMGGRKELCDVPVCVLDPYSSTDNRGGHQENHEDPIPITG